MKRLLLLAAGIALALALWYGASRDTARPNVLFVVLDTTRADKLGCYGGERGVTPYLDAFADEGLRFERASSHAPWTLPSTASMLTSLHPNEHGAGGRLGKFTSVDPSVETVAGVFGERGYASHAIVNVGFLDPKSYGVTRDFATVDIVAPQSNTQMRDASTTTDAALRWLDGRATGKEPFFLFVHYFDPHAVYAPPQPFRRKFASEADRDDERWVFGTREHMINLRAGKLELGGGVIRRAEKLYDGEMAYTDAQVGRLLDGLAERGLAADTIVVVTADHGEEFLDHDGFEHGHTLYSELTDVPLLLRYPGVEPGVVSAPVAHIDLAPTLCELANIAAPEQFVGRSLLDVARDPASADRGVLAHGNMWADPLTSWRSGDLKLIVSSEGTLELYDLASDPREALDLAATEPARAQELLEELRAVERLMQRRGGGAVELSDEDLERLRDIGYVGAEDD